MVGVTLWYSASVIAQMPLVPIPNAVGLADQRLNLLPADGYQLIEQANQAFQADQILRAGDRLNQLLYQFGDHLVPLPDHTEGEFKSFVSVIDFVMPGLLIRNDRMSLHRFLKQDSWHH